MSMNIKSEEAHRLAKELAAETGESVTAAVTIALRERLERLHNERAKRLERLRAIMRDAAAHVSEEFRSLDYNKMLYDERGLPRDDR